MNKLSEDILNFSASHHLSEKRPIFTQIIEYENVWLHRHQFIEFFYVFEGSCSHILNGQRSQIRTGDAFFMTPNDVHRFTQASNDFFLHRDILISLDFFKESCSFYSPTLYEDLLNGKYHLQFSLSIEQMTMIENFVPMLGDSPDNKNYALTLKALTSFIINLILEHNLQKAHNYPTWLTRLLSMLNAHENLTVELSQIISHFAYSKEYLRRSFKKYIGMTMTDYFNKQKMIYAYSLLQTTSYSIEKICEMIGLTNTAYFYQLFKRHFHCTPHSVRSNKPHTSLV